MNTINNIPSILTQQNGVYLLDHSCL